ncbi:hypothetical protein [Ancylobacter sp. FA202]|uniref:hypothetical protein n=1 Tax=Ancylobacter sp. FA202 TaxID=1111106 RepID=UPI0018DED34B|nr:hypothetical protein [Ancylobacter sp. FA202]
MSSKSQTAALYRSIRRYFSAYGGWRSILYSPLFFVAIILTAADYNNWMKAEWVDQSKSILPNLLGFSLGTYAILFSLLTNRVKRSLQATTNERGISNLEVVNATFFHFIFIQLLAILWAMMFSGSIIVDAFKFSLLIQYKHLFVFLFLFGSFVGLLLLNYSLMLILGSALAIYRLAGITDRGEDAPSEIELRIANVLEKIEKKLRD